MPALASSRASYCRLSVAAIPRHRLERPRLQVTVADVARELLGSPRRGPGGLVLAGVELHGPTQQHEPGGAFGQVAPR
jgi:hypothetical protein